MGRGTAVDGAKRPATGDISRIRYARVSTTTRRNCHRDGGGVASGGFRTRTSALTGGGATSTGWTTSVMALGRVAGASEEARGRTDDDTGFRNNHERGIFFCSKTSWGRAMTTSSRGYCKKLPMLQTSPPSATRTRVKSNRTAFVLYTSDAPPPTRLSPAPEPPLPPRVPRQRLAKVPLPKVRPHSIREVKLRVRQFPQEKVGHPSFPAGPDEQVGLAHLRR